MDKNSNSKRNKFLFKAISYALAIGVVLYGIKMLGEGIRQHPIYILIGILVVACMIFLKFKGGELVDRVVYGQVNLTRIQFAAIIKGLNNSQFEVFASELFKALGYRVKVVEEGVEKNLILNDEIYVQCKKGDIEIIDEETCQKLLGATVAHGKEHAILLTVGHCNEAADEFISKTKNKLMIWDIDTLYKKINTLDKHKRSKIIDESLAFSKTPIYS